MPLNRTTIRALAASMAMVTAGGTVAAAAVFHLPVLGFEATGAGASQGHVEQAAVADTARPVAPRRVVKTRVVTDVVHHHAPAPTAPHPAAAAAAATVPPPASVATALTTVPTPPPVAQPPVAPAPGGGDDGHEADNGHGDDAHEHNHDGHGGDEGDDTPTSGAGQSVGGIQAGQ